MREQYTTPLLTQAEEIALSLSVAQGSRSAIAKFTESNVGLVVSIAKRFVLSGVPLEDLTQDGNLGLLKAIHKFDPERGVRFATLATWWIRQAIGRAIDDTERTIRIPTNMAGHARRVYRARQELQQQSSIEPTDAQIAERARVAENMVPFLSEILAPTISLDRPQGSTKDEADRSQFESIPEQALTPEEEFTLVEQAEVISRIWGLLSPCEQYVLSEHLALNGKRKRSFSQIGEALGVSAYTVKLIEKSSLSRLRVYFSPDECLSDYLNS